jgi:hypothetical protein
MDRLQVRYDFLRTEVRLGLTFLGLAQAAGDDTVKAARNFINARKAYDALERFRQVVEMTAVQSLELQAGMKKIADGLIASGQ